MIKPPAWCSKAVATPKGWKHHTRKEILLAKKLTQEDCDEYNNAMGNVLAQAAPTPKPAPAPIVNEDVPVSDVDEDGFADDLESLTKAELEQLGREHGVELDRRKSKKKLVEAVKGILT
jgi:hypothetical protein